MIQRKTLNLAFAATLLAVAVSVPAMDLLSTQALELDGDNWQVTENRIRGSGTGQFATTRQAVGAGNFRIDARLTIENLEASAASFHFGRQNHFGFSSRSGILFVEGPIFGSPGNVRNEMASLITDGEPFDFSVVRRGDQISVTIDGENVYTAFSSAGPLAPFGFRPWRSTMTIESLEYSGQLISIEEALAAQQEDNGFERIDAFSKDIFVSGEGDYHTYRIPAIVQTNSGVLLAFAEGRRAGRSDTGEIELLLRRSEDGGDTWSPIQVVWSDEGNTCGNPAPVVDRSTGRVILMSTWNRGTDTERQILAGTSEDTRRVFTLHSDDEGQTWSGPREITDSVKDPHWRWYATGPCHAIQMEDGTIVIPANHSDHTDGPDAGQWDHYRAHMILSEDGGETWRRSSVVGPKTNESTVVEIPGGRLVMNMRSYENVNRRAVAWTDDKGETWSKTWLDPELVEPRCQASLLRVDREGNSIYLFSHPAATTRTRMTITWSKDHMLNWEGSYLAYEDSSAYSDVVDLGDGHLGLLFERDDYGRITFQRIALDDLTSAPNTVGPLVP